jgi:hypothetical protein
MTTKEDYHEVLRTQWLNNERTKLIFERLKAESQELKNKATYIATQQYDEKAFDCVRVFLIRASQIDVTIKLMEAHE